jgi:hypothetical protein
MDISATPLSIRANRNEKFAIEDGYKVIYAECIPDARRLVNKANGGDRVTG